MNSQEKDGAETSTTCNQEEAEPVRQLKKRKITESDPSTGNEVENPTETLRKKLEHKDHDRDSKSTLVSEGTATAAGGSNSKGDSQPKSPKNASASASKVESQADSTKNSAENSNNTGSSGKSGSGGGKERKRSRRRMNREARQRGEEPPPDNRRDRRRDYPPQDRQWERDRDFRDRRGPPPQDYQRRGPPPQGWSGLPGRNEYDYSTYRTSTHPNHNNDGGRRRSTPHDAASNSSSSRSNASLSPSRSRGRSESRSKSRSRSRDNRGGSGSRSLSRSDHNSKGSAKRSRSNKDDAKGSKSGSRQNSRSNGGSSGRKRRDRGSYKRSYDHNPRKRRTYSSSSHSDSTSSSSSEDEGDKQVDESAFSKDQRTVFVSQLVMRATKKDIRRYFKRKLGCRVREVILLQDKRTGNHKGYAYVQMGRIEDVNKAVAAAGQPPDFQRFPILIKASEAEKNYVVPVSSSTVTASMMGTTLTPSPVFTKDGKTVEAQNVYVGGLDPMVSEEHLFAIFSQFGQLEKVSMQVDPVSTARRGYAFLKFRDPKEANLAIQTMENQVLAGRPMKTGWANQVATVSGVDVVTSSELPVDSSVRARKALCVLAQLMGSSEASVLQASLLSTAEKALEAAMGGKQFGTSKSATGIASVADARAVAASTSANLLTSTVEKSKLIGGLEKPSKFILVFNMYDKDEETEDGWEKEINDEFKEECSKFGTINSVVVMSKEPGGKIYAAFETVEGAEECAKNLAGRWFDKRQLRVDYVEESEIRKAEVQ